VATLAVTGEVFTAGAMSSLDFDALRVESGMSGAIRAVMTNPKFLAGVLAMTLNFFAMLYTLSVVDVSLAAPATAALTYIGNAFAAKLFLRENVDRRRWMAALFVVVGVVLLAK
jgi:drug/metabolite transporter (DMT)-like permease